MTTQIAGLMSGQGWNPLQRWQNQLQSAVTSGTVKSADQDALSAALTDISAQLQSGGASSSGAAVGPQSRASRIDGLISGEVSSGKLTADQATELKTVFAQAAQKMHGHHHHGGGNDGDGDDGNTASAATATNFVDFLKQLEAALTQSVNAVTGTSASTDTSVAQSGTTGTTATTASTSVAANDPKALMLNFIKQLETALGGGNTYGASGSGGSTDAQGVLVNALA